MTKKIAALLVSFLVSLLVIFALTTSPPLMAVANLAWLGLLVWAIYTLVTWLVTK